MNPRRMGRSSLLVSELCLGTMMFGDQTDRAEAERIVGDARERGVNFLDTADVYAVGGSEEMVGQLVRPHRDDWVVATKVGNAMSDRENTGGYSRAWMMRALEDSLRRLATDRVEIYYLHRDFDGIHLEEPLRALDDMIRSGKVRGWGISNFRGWRIAELVRLAGELGLPRPVVCQPYYNLLNRMPEVEILPACDHYGIGVVPYSPAARGVLTGKYLPGATPDAGTRAGRGDRRMMQTEFRQESLEIAQELRAHAEAKGLTLLQLATAWVLANRTVTSVIAGPRTLAQWTDYLPALDVALGPDDEAAVDRFVQPGHPSTPGYTDPANPVLGRAI